MKESRYWHVAVMALAGVTFGLFGCSDDGVGRRYAVTGTVTYKNEPVEKGAITFTPAKADVGRVATGTIEKGSYTLSTLGDKDGAIPGDYKVSITD